MAKGTRGRNFRLQGSGDLSHKWLDFLETKRGLGKGEGSRINFLHRKA